MPLSSITAFTPIAERSEATPGLWNSRFQQIMDNFNSMGTAAAIWHNVKLYGAKGDGITDDANAIQLALSAATLSGGMVFIPPGTYITRSGLTIDGGVTVWGAGGPSDTDGGVGTVAQTTIDYRGSGVAITVAGTPTQGISNVHLANFALNGTVDAVGGLLIGSASGGAQQVKHSSVKNLTVNGFSRTSAYGVCPRRMLTSVFENVFAIANHDGFSIMSDGNVTTLTFTDCHGYNNDRNGLRVDNPASSPNLSFHNFVAESNGNAGVYLDGASILNFYDLYCEDNNNDSGGSAPIMVGSTATCNKINFYTPYVQDPASNVTSFYFNQANRCVIYNPNLEFASTGWCIVTSRSLECATYSPDGLQVGSVTGNSAGRMRMLVPRSGAQGATAAVADGGTIAHGLGLTPGSARVTPSQSGEFASVTGLDATNITVAIKKHDGTAGTTQTIYWDVGLN